MEMSGVWLFQHNGEMNELSRAAAQGSRQAVLECCAADALFFSNAANHDHPGVVASLDTEKTINRTRIAINVFS
jgi:hypothetical protein